MAKHDWVALDIGHSVDQVPSPCAPGRADLDSTLIVDHIG